MTPLLGWVEPLTRTPEQHAAHSAIMATIPRLARFALPSPQLAPGQSVRLFDYWSHPEVVADVGFVFERFRQLTGSCVKVGGASALFSTIAVQRAVSETPTKAFLPFCWHNYAMSRHYMGDDGRGEGSLGSTFAKSLITQGVRDWVQGTDGMPTYSRADGISITSEQELEWSSFRNPKLNKIIEVSDDHLLGNAVEATTVEEIRTLVINGYAVTFACNNFIGNAAIRGSGENARVMGRWDSRGGHQQSIHAVEEHKDFGPIYWAQNTWGGDTYPRDPSGGPECGCWVSEADVKAALRLDAEVFGLSHLNWFLAQPKLVRWFM